MIRSTLLAVGLFAHLSAAETLLVPEQYPTISAAIDSANDGDEISIAEGTYISAVVINSNEYPTGLLIKGRGLAASTIIQPPDNGDNTAFFIEGALVPSQGIKVENLTIDGFTTFYTNNGRLGCGVHVAINPSGSLASRVFVKGVRFTNCSAFDSNYAICTWGNYENCLFEDCHTENDNMVWDGYPSPDSDVSYLKNCTFRRCDAFWISGTTKRLSGCTFEECHLRRGIFKEGQALISDCVFTGNTYSETLIQCRNSILQDCVFQDNSWTGFLGQSYGTPVLIDSSPGTIVIRCEFLRNHGLQGGAIMSRENATLSYCNFVENTAELLGGAVYAESGTLSTGNITGCGNYPNDFAGLPATCEASGPCCLGTACIELLETDCTNNGGEILDAPCSESNCSSEGACCISGTCTVTTVETCFSLGGSFAGNNTDCSTTDCPSSCEGDVSGNGTVDFTDLLILINNWGNCPS